MDIFQGYRRLTGDGVSQLQQGSAVERRGALWGSCRGRLGWLTRIAVCLLFSTMLLAGCAEHLSEEDQVLTSYTRIDLMDWHVSGLWVINSPVAWIRVTNYNNVPIKDITFQYNTYDANGKALDQGTFTIEGTVPPRQIKNFIELYLGLVDLYSERLYVKLLSVKKAG